MLSRLNGWYENLKEPWRLIAALFFISPIFFLIDRNNPVCAGIALIYALFLMLWRVVFITKSRGKHQPDRSGSG